MPHATSAYLCTCPQDLLDLPKDQFEQHFLPIVRGDLFSAVVSRGATISEILNLGEILKAAGLTYLARDPDAIARCTYTITEKVYREYYRRT